MKIIFNKEILEAYAKEVTKEMDYYNNMTQEQRVEYYEDKAQEAKNKIAELKNEIENPDRLGFVGIAISISILEKEIKEAEEAADYYRNGGLTMRQILAD